MQRPRIGFAFPQRRDLRELAAAGLGERYDVALLGGDLDAGGEDDEVELLEELAARAPALDGIVGTKDRAALAAAILAQRLGLPGPTPAAIVACQHKPTMRTLAARVVPEATPHFALAADGVPPFGPPWFVKPVVGRLSQHARRVDSAAELAALDADHRYAEGYGRLAALAGFEPAHFRGHLVEELVAGPEVTFEGYVHEGRVVPVGVTDSIHYPGTRSFHWFAYPTALPAEREAELTGVVERLVPALGLDGCFFNVEFFVPEDAPATVIEVNPRLASQFAPLRRALGGRSTYEGLLALAAGRDPASAGRPRGAAVSYVVRVFADALVAAVPEEADDLEVLVEPGRLLSEQAGGNDVASFRTAIVVASGADADEAVAHARERAAGLAFALRPVP